MSFNQGEVKERPILFNGEMVRASLDGRKTQTRRVIKPQPKWIEKGHPSIGDQYWDFDWCYYWPESTYVHTWDDHGIGGPNWTGSQYSRENVLEQALKVSPKSKKCPYGKPGDRLWVRETFWVNNDTEARDYAESLDCGSTLSLGPEYCTPQYCATPECFDPPKPKGKETVAEWKEPPTYGFWWLSPPDDWDGHREYHGEGEWQFLPSEPFTKHPSIHMPRWASRITLEITNVRVERLNDISEEDAWKEGFPDPDGQNRNYPDRARYWFKCLWNNLAGQDSPDWYGNPWVWVIEFKRIAP